MNHVLHLMLMGLGREGSISIAYQFYFPIYRSTARSVGDVGAVARAGASMPGRTHSMHYGVTSVPVLHPCARHRFGVELDIST
jgi:hypothetical protein